MRKILIIIAVGLLLLPESYSQPGEYKKIEITGGAGITQMFCDIGGYSRGENLLGLRDFSFRHTRFNLSGGMRYRILQNVAVRGNLAFGCLHATDARGSNVRRGFQSKSIFFEPSLLGEFFFLKLNEEESYRSSKGDRYRFSSFLSSLNPYLFAGIGGLSYSINPNTALAQRATKNRGFTAIIPGGVGASLNYSENFNLGLEVGARYSFSDHIEGYTSQFSRANDVYYFLNFTIAYKLSPRSE